MSPYESPNIVIDPKFGAKPLLDLQLAAGIRGDFETGWKICKRLAKETPECHRAAFNRAWYLMRRGDLLGGLECLDRGRWLRVFGDRPLPTSKPIFRGEPLAGKKLLVCSEGGLGDEIVNVRFAKNFSDLGADVTVTCDPSLMSLFSRVPGASSVVAHRSAPDIYHDYWVPGMSAAHVLKTTNKSLTGKPYLSVDPEFKKKWRQYFADRYGKKNQPRIGLRFYGNPEFEHEQHRRFPQELLISALEGRPWVNLQQEETDFRLDSWDDTLAVIDQLDLIITSCTSVAHASAALGKKTWIILPILPYYLWALPGSKTPWYNSAKLFRQQKYGNWQEVFLKIAKQLPAGLA